MACANDNCEKAADELESCPMCNDYIYCNKDCRRQDWLARHQYECNKGKKFSLKDFKVIQDHNQQILGKGTYGEVRLVQSLDSGQYYALKEIKKQKYLETDSIEILRREIDIHKDLNHPNIIKMIQYFEDTDNVYILLEYASRGSLFYMIRRQKGLSEEKS